jgi:hypothetical protein
MSQEYSGSIDTRRLAMACFLEGVEPTALALAPRHLIQVEEVFRELREEIPTVAYYRCLESLTSDEEREAI